MLVASPLPLDISEEHLTHEPDAPEGCRREIGTARAPGVPAVGAAVGEGGAAAAGGVGVSSPPALVRSLTPSARLPRALEGWRLTCCGGGGGGVDGGGCWGWCWSSAPPWPCC